MEPKVPIDIAERNLPGTGFQDLLSVRVTVKGFGGQKEILPISNLTDLDLDRKLLDNVGKILKKLTPVQKYALPIITKRANLIACSYTGTGKTAAFLVPILNMVIKKHPVKAGSSPARPLVLILVPTRELAIQIKEEADSFVKNTVLKNSIHLVCGGKDVDKERKRLSTLPCAVVVATIGRLVDLLGQYEMDIGGVKYFILDEADEMMAKNFYFDVKEISGMCSENHFSAIFSATYPNAVRKAAENLLGNKFLEVLIGEDGATASKTITQEFQLVERSEKDYHLKNLLDSVSPKDKVLIFGATILDVERVEKFLSTFGFNTAVLHSKLETQRQREAALALFEKSKVHILIATSVAARGLDIPNVSMVVNYDMPSDIEEYVLRIGRTGRVGNAGRSYSFFEVERDGPLADKLISSLRRADQYIPSWMREVRQKMIDDAANINEAYGTGEFSNNQRTFNALGSSILGVPCPCEAEDDTWD